MIRKLLLLGAAGFLVGAGVAWAQVTGLVSKSLSGNETWNVSVGGPQGPSFFTSVAQMRNGINPVVSNLTTGTFSMPITGGNLILTGAATSGLTINLPANPYDGQIFEVLNGTGSTFASAPTIAVTDGSTIVNGTSVTTLAAGASKEWRYVLSTTSWYAMR